MSECECLAKCPFFNDKMANMPSMASLLKQKYCMDEWRACARHRVFVELGREAVPVDLFPNQEDQATAVLLEAKG